MCKQCEHHFLNHILIITKYSILFIGNVELHINHFTEVRPLIWRVRRNYRNLGYAIGITPDVMSTIETKNIHDVERCFDDVLTEILNKGVMQEDLAKALESEMVRNKQLAQRVRAASFSFGKILIIMTIYKGGQVKEDHTKFHPSSQCIDLIMH